MPNKTKQHTRPPDTRNQELSQDEIAAQLGHDPVFKAGLVRAIAVAEDWHRRQAQLQMQPKDEAEQKAA